MFKLKKNFSALFCFCAVMFITYRTCADICFLPSMECADANAGNGGGGTPDNCTDTCSAHGWKDSAGACSYGYDIKTDNCRNTCYACKDCTDTCSNHGWTSAYSTCQYGYEKKDKICNTQCYQCNACTPKECSGYDLTTKPASGGDTYDICDPGCEPKLYKCASGYKYESGKCTKVTNCTNNGMYDTKEDCDKAIKNESHKKCVVSGKCYTIEKNCGTNEYVDEATCKNANPSYSCKRTSDGVCWEKDKYICDETSEFASEDSCKAKYSGYNCKQNSNNCWIKGDKEDKLCNPANYPYVKIKASDASAMKLTDWTSNKIFGYLKTIDNVYVAHTDHFEGTFDEEIYNRIADDAEKCIDAHGRERFNKICGGTPKNKCSTGGAVSFIENGCTSSQYTAHYDDRNYYQLSGAVWGECKKDCSIYGSEYYATFDECKQNNSNKTCMSDSAHGRCYKTCEAAGYYSWQADCENGKAGTCVKIGSCYTRNTFFIKQTRTKYGMTCDGSGASYNVSWWAYLTMGRNMGYATDVNGYQVSELSDSKREVAAGTYSLCVAKSDNPCTTYWGIRSTRITGYTIGKDGNPVYGFSPVSGLCFGDTPPSGCEQTEKLGPRWSCHSFNFQPGYIYEVSADVDW